jgi:short-subunit dehydrogenase
MAINEELRQNKSNVQVSALCPGPVATEFNKVAKGTFAIKEASSEFVAKYGINKTLEKKMIIVPTLKMKLALFFNRLLPYRFQLIIAYHIQKRKSTEE